MVIKSRRVGLAGMHGREICRGGWLENLKERGRLEDLGIDERVVLKCISKTRCEGVDVIYLVQFRYRGELA